MILTITGPSGSGKTVLRRRLLKHPGIKNLVSSTTRAPRKGEKEGEDYFFVNDLNTPAKFDKRKYSFQTFFDSNWYALKKDCADSAANDNKNTWISIVDKIGALEMKKAYGDKVITLYIEIDPYKAKDNMKFRKGGKKRAIARQKIDKEMGLLSPYAEEKDNRKILYDVVIKNSNDMNMMVNDVINVLIAKNTKGKNVGAG